MEFKSKFEEFGYYLGKNLFFFTKRQNNTKSKQDSQIILITVLTLCLAIFLALGWYMFFGNFPVDGHRNYYYKIFEPNRGKKTSERSIELYPKSDQVKKSLL